MTESFDRFSIQVELHWPIGWVETWMLDLREDGYTGGLNGLVESLRSVVKPSDYEIRVHRISFDAVGDNFDYADRAAHVEIKTGSFDRTELVEILESISAPILASWSAAELAAHADDVTLRESALDFAVRMNGLAQKRRATITSRTEADRGPPWTFMLRLWKSGRPKHEAYELKVVIHDHLGIVRSWRLLNP